MMHKRKFGAGGPAKRPTPTPADRAAARAQDEMLKKAKVTKSEAATIASANRSEGGTHKKGGMIKRRYADGGMAGAAIDLEAAARRGENLRELDRMNLSVPKIAAAKPKPKPKPAAAKPATSGMSDAEIRKFMSDNDRGADASARNKVTKPAARQEPRVGLHNLKNVLGSTRKFGESIGFRNTPRPEADKPAATKPAARQEPRVGLQNSKNVLGSTRKFGESIGFRNTPRPEADKPAAKPAARQEPRVGLQNIGNPFASMRKFGESIGFRNTPRPEAAKPAATKPAAAKPAAAKPAAAKPAARSGMSDAQIRKFMSDNDRAADRSLAAKPATRGMSDAQIRKFMSDNDRAANRSLDDTKIRKFMSDNDRAADRSLAATKAKKEAKMASDIGKATTASLSAAASRAIPRTPGMPMRSGAGKPATSGMSDAEIRKFMRDNERGYEETAARKTPNPISRTAKATGTAAKPRLVEPKYAKGGFVSKRADGIAKKGHTKGRIC